MKAIVIGLLLTFAAAFCYAPSVHAFACTALGADLRYRAVDATTKGSVTMLQDFLVVAGYLKVRPTGYFGPATLRAVQAFQKAHRLYAAGFVGPQTRAKIKEHTCVPEHSEQASSTGSTGSLQAGSLQSSGGQATSTGSTGSPQASAGQATSTAAISTSTTTGSVSGGFAAPADPDAKATYLAIRAEYDAAPTLRAFIEVSARYASASRAGDVAAQRNFLNELSAEEQADFLNSTIRGMVPSASEIDSVGMVVGGSKATLLVLPRAASGKDAKGLVVLILEGGAWKLEREQWQKPDGSGIEPLPSSSGG